MSDQIILQVEHLKKYYKMPGRGLLEKPKVLKALDDVSFEIKNGETLGIVGESGCGKTTLGQIICGLKKPTGGRIIYNGNSWEDMKKSHEIQFIFQDPYSSLNPKMNVGDLIAEPLDANKKNRKADKKERRKKIEEYMKLVELDINYMHSYPRELSGGMRQRVGIARALISNAKLVICDEAVSALDVSVQAQIMNLLMDIKQEKKISFVFISHDLHVVNYISDYILVLFKGRVVEYAKKEKLFSNPCHPYTIELLDAVPKANPGTPPTTEEIKEMEDYVGEAGCIYYNRCKYRTEECKEQNPDMKKVEEEHWALCNVCP